MGGALGCAEAGSLGCAEAGGRTAAPKLVGARLRRSWWALGCAEAGSLGSNKLNEFRKD